MTAGGRVDLSIVIVNFKSWDKLSGCLASLAPLVGGGAPSAEIIVVDNVSGDGRLAAFAAEHPIARFILNDGNWGFADGCNRGAAEARGELLLFLNPDAEDRDGGVAKLVATARAHPAVAIFTARQVDENGRVQKAFDAFPSLATLSGAGRAVLRAVAPARYPDPRHPQAEFREVDWISGSAFLVRRDVFESLGGFCNGFWMYSEDVDLCRRARDAGHGVGFDGTITLIHAHGGATRKNPETAALTRSEVVVSRHYYASRHFGAVHAAAYHFALAVSRFAPCALAIVADAVGFGASRAVRVRALMGRHLARYYRSVPSRGWRSLRAK